MLDTSPTQTGTVTRDDVKRCLEQYRSGEIWCQVLEERRHNIICELRAVHEEFVGGPAPDIDAVEAMWITEQRETEASMLRALDLMMLLPPGSAEREIVELRHIHGLQWKEISAALFLARSNIFRHYNAALDMLTRHERTGEIMKKFQAERQARAEVNRSDNQ